MSREDNFKNRSRKIHKLSSKSFNLVDDQEEDFKDVEDFEETENYSAGKIIASGGLKNVWRVRDRKSSRYVAMAQLKPEYKSALHNDRFLKEAKILASLEHANIVPIHEINYDKDERLFFTMKLLNGESLASILKKIRKGEVGYIEKYPLKRLLEIFIRVCDAIIYAHEQDIVHLDLKPENIQITEFGEVYVLDWGMAKHITDTVSSLYEENDAPTFMPVTENQTQMGTINGTPGFMSPEQINRDTQVPTTPSDIYSLGATLYNILYKEAPHHGLKTEDVIEKTIQGIHSVPKKKLSKREAPSAIRAIIEKSMSLEEFDRYRSVKSLQNDILLYLNDFATQAEDMNILSFAKLFLKRHFKSVAIISLVLSSIGFTLFYSYNEIRKQEAIANKQSNRIKATTKEIIAGTMENDKFLRKQFRYKDLLQNYKKLIKQGFNLSKFWYEAGKLNAGELNFSEALRCFEEAAKLDGKLYEDALYKKVIHHLKLAKDFTQHRDLSYKELLTYAINMHDETQHQIFWNLYQDEGMSIEEKLLHFKEAIIFYNKINPEYFYFNYSIENGYTKLDISKNNNLLQIGPIIGLPINELNLSEVDVNTGSTIHYLKRLNSLNLSNPIANMSDADLIESNLETIITRNTRYRALDLKLAPKLKHLDIEGTEIIKSGIVTPSQTLEYINIAFSDFKYFHMLQKCKNLKTVVIDESMTAQAEKILTREDINIIIKRRPDKDNSIHKIPGIIQSEDYSDMNGIGILNTPSQTSDQYISFINKGDRLSYLTNISDSGLYKISFRVSSKNTPAEFKLIHDDDTLIRMNITPTKDDQNWVTKFGKAYLSSGSNKLSIVSESDDWNINWMRFQRMDGYYKKLPGRVQAEHFVFTNDVNGGTTNETWDIGGGECLIHIDAGDYFDYDVNVQKSGTYICNLRVTSEKDINLDLKLNDKLLHNFTSKPTGGIRNWINLKKELDLPAGKHKLRVHANESQARLNWINFKSSTADQIKN